MQLTNYNFNRIIIVITDLCFGSAFQRGFAKWQFYVKTPPGLVFIPATTISYCLLHLRVFFNRGFKKIIIIMMMVMMIMTMTLGCWEKYDYIYLYSRHKYYVLCIRTSCNFTRNKSYCGRPRRHVHSDYWVWASSATRWTAYRFRSLYALVFMKMFIHHDNGSIVTIKQKIILYNS